MKKYLFSLAYRSRLFDQLILKFSINTVGNSYYFKFLECYLLTVLYSLPLLLLSLPVNLMIKKYY